MINNKRSYTEYNITSPTTDFAIGFENYGVGAKDIIEVTLNGVLVESIGYTVRLKNAQVLEVSPAIEAGTVRLQRVTAIDNSFHKFTAGALFTAKSMDENFEQIRHSQQEVRDGFVFLEHNTNGIVQASKEATAQARVATVEATASAVRAETAADTAVQAVGSLQGVVDAATTATTNANAATATATTAVSQATAATTSAQNAAQAANTAKQEAATAATSANAATVDTLAATGRANEAADVVADLVVGKVRAQDVSTVDGSTQEEFNTGVTNKLTRQYVSDVSSLKALMSNTVGEVVYVVSVGANYTFKTTTNSPINTSTVVQGIDGVWEMEDRDDYYASWFATPDVQESQTLQLQAGYDYATLKGRPFIIDGTYWISSSAQKGSGTQYLCGLKIRSYSTLKFNVGSKLKILSTNSARTMGVICSDDITDFVIEYPHIVGDRLIHDFSAVGSHESTFALAIFECSNGHIINPLVEESVGDGIYIGKTWGSPTSTVPTNIIIDNPRVNNVGRNGISLCAWKDVYINNPIVDRVGVHPTITNYEPKCGIDVEPEAADNNVTCENGVISNAVFKNCARGINTFWGIPNVKLTLHFTGTTKIIDCNAIELKCMAALNVGHIKFDHLALIGKVKFIWNWVADHLMYLYIDLLTYDYTGSWFEFSVGNYTNPTKTLGNSFININAITIVRYTLVYGTDFGDYTLQRITLKSVNPAFRISQGLDSTNTMAKYPKLGVGCVLEGDTHLSGDYDMSNYRGMDNIIYSSVDGGAAVTLNFANYVGKRIRITLPPYDVNKFTITGITLRIRGAIMHRAEVVDTYGAWVELTKVGANLTYIHNSSGGWNFNTYVPPVVPVP